MANSVNLFVQRLRILLDPARRGRETDGQLLARWATSRDEPAFAALVARHGALVWHVGRNVLHQPEDIEDVFQATFLVLARKAASLQKRPSIAGWLYQTALHLGLKARHAAARRLRQEDQARPRTAVDPLEEISVREARAILADELNHLGVAYCEPLLLCLYEGATQEEAARRLGCSLKTLQRRLERGRALLAKRLSRRGLAPASGLAVTLCSRTQAPAQLVQMTIAAATQFGSGQVMTGTAAFLAESVLRTLALKKLAGHLALVIVLGGLTLGAGVAVFPKTQAIAKQGPPAAAAQEAPEPPKVKELAPRVDANGNALPPGAIARLGSLAFNHGQWLDGMHFTPDGKRVVSIGAGLIRIWDSESGREIRHMAMPKGYANSVETTLRNDGKTLVVLDNGHYVTIVDLETEKIQKRQLVNPAKSQRGVFYARLRNALSPNGELAVTFSPSAIGIHGIDSGETLCQISADATKFSAATFAGNTRVVTATEDQNIEIWDAKTGKSLRRLRHGAPAEHMVASEDGQLLAVLEHHVLTGDRLLTDTVHIWDLTKGERLHRITAPSCWFMELRFAPKAPWLFARRYSNGRNITSVWNVATGREIDSPKDEYWFPNAFSPDGKRFISGRLMWDAQKIAPINPERNPHAFAHKVWLSHRGDDAVVVGYSISTWDANTGRRRSSFGVGPSYQSETAGIDRVISRDGRLATSYRPGASWHPSHVVVRDVATGRQLHTIQPDPKAAQWQTTFSPDAQTMALWVPKLDGDQPTVQIWDLKTGRLARSFTEPKVSFGSQLSYSSDGKTLVIYGDCVAGYDVDSGKERFCWKIPRLQPDLSGMKKTDSTGKESESSPARGVALAPDANLVACIQSTNRGNGPPDRTAVLLDGQTGTVQLRWEYEGKLQWGIDLLEFSPDAHLLAVTDGNIVHVFEVATGKRLHTLTEHRSEISRLAFSGNARRLAAAARDSTIMIWDVGPKSNEVKLDWEQCWADLLSDDARRALAAVNRMMDSPGAAAGFLSRHLKPASKSEQDAIVQLIATLDDASFVSRQKATDNLRKLGRIAAPALRTAWSKPLPLEAKRRVQSLLESAVTGALTGEALRTWRALPILEHSDSRECRRLLQSLADGADGAWLTEMARASMTRVNLRSK